MNASAESGNDLSSPHLFNRYVVCFLDVLGFKSRFDELKLGGMLEKYVDLINTVNAENFRNESVFSKMEFDESAYWTSSGDVFIFSQIFGSYASDSIVVFAYADFPENRYPLALNLNPEERERLAQDEGWGWKYHTIPCDHFLNTCNELICRSIEIGLPLRGAISLGEAVLHIDRGIYLGKPLIDTSGLECEQLCIGTSFAQPFLTQVVPKRYALPFDTHFKGEIPPIFSGFMLDWPRHWRNTRSQNPIEALKALDRNSRFKKFYDKSIEIVEASNKVSHLFEDPDETYVTKVYPQFSGSKLQANARAARKVLIGPAEPAAVDLQGPSAAVALRAD